MKLMDVLIKPIVTEKTTALVNRNIYAFEVSLKATKPQIAAALTKLYSVEVGRVHVNIRKGKTRRVGKRMTSKLLTNRKIAYITITKGKIDLFPKA